MVGYDGNSQYFGYDLGLSVDEILDYWKNANHCVDEPIIDTLPDLHNDGLRFVRLTYEGEAELQHIKVIGGNHNWYNNENQYDISYMKEIHTFFTTGGGHVGLAEREQKYVSLYPNPTSGQCFVEMETASTAEVIDLQGRRLLSCQMRQGINRLDLTGFSEGLYLIRSADGIIGKVLIKK